MQEWYIIWLSQYLQIFLSQQECQKTESSDEDTDNDKGDEVSFGNEWNSIIQDDDFLDLLCESFEVEQLLRPSCDGSSISSEDSHTAGNDIPDPVLELLENISYKD